MRILIAEDDENLREGIAFSLSLDGFEIATASDVKETLERLKKEPLDLVLLDCNFPDGSGFEVCRKMRGFCNVPVLMLTARDTEMDEIRALEMGADDFMSKPFSLAAFKGENSQSFETQGRDKEHLFKRSTNIYRKWGSLCR